MKKRRRRKRYEEEKKKKNDLKGEKKGWGTWRKTSTGRGK